MDNYGEILIYQSDDGLTNIEVKVQDETVWLTQQQMADLFRTSRTNVVEHIKHIYDEGELDENSTCRNFRQVRKEGNREVAREMPFYNLDMIISLGYRVKSAIATNFRRWATERLKEYMGGMGMGGDVGGRGNMTDMGKRPSGEVPSTNKGEQQASTNTDEDPTAPGQNGAQNRPGGGVSGGESNMPQMPEGFDPENMPEGGEFPFGQNGGEEDTFPNQSSTENVVRGGNSVTLILMLSSILILTLGIVFAFNYRRRR